MRNVVIGELPQNLMFTIKITMKYKQRFSEKCNVAIRQGKSDKISLHDVFVLSAKRRGKEGIKEND